MNDRGSHYGPFSRKGFCALTAFRPVLPFLGRQIGARFCAPENPENPRAGELDDVNLNGVDRNVKLLVLAWPNGTKINALRMFARHAARCAACRRAVAFAVRDAVARAFALARARAIARAWALAFEFRCLRAVALAFALACARAVLEAFRDAADRFLCAVTFACGRVFAAARVTLCAARAEAATFAGVVVDFRVAVWVATFTAWVARRADTAARRVVCRPHAIPLPVN